jgi:hypothetical protein
MGEGTAPYHWILDEAGALIVADLLGRDRAELGWRHSVAASIATSQNLAHHIEVNEFFTRLAIEANEAGGALSEWYGERTCHHAFSGKVVPDGWGVVTLPGRGPLHLLVELDRGTEASSRLRKKTEDYEESLPYSSRRPRHRAREGAARRLLAVLGARDRAGRATQAPALAVRAGLGAGRAHTRRAAPRGLPPLLPGGESLPEAREGAGCRKRERRDSNPRPLP